MKKLLSFLFLTLFFLIVSNKIYSQLKIGYQARTLVAPKVTLLDLSVDTNSTYGKGFIYPVVNTFQRNAMLGVNGNILPTGLTIYNKDNNAIEIYTSANSWMSVSGNKSQMITVYKNGLVPTTAAAVINNPNTDFNGNNNIFTFAFFTDKTKKLVINPKTNIVFNKIPLKNGVDFTLDSTDPANIKITFLTLIPDNPDGFDNFDVEFAN